MSCHPERVLNTDFPLRGRSSSPPPPTVASHLWNLPSPRLLCGLCVPAELRLAAEPAVSFRPKPEGVQSSQSSWSLIPWQIQNGSSLYKLSLSLPHPPLSLSLSLSLLQWLRVWLRVLQGGFLQQVRPIHIKATSLGLNKGTLTPWLNPDLYNKILHVNKSVGEGGDF